jgi:hypothetical protein
LLKPFCPNRQDFPIAGARAVFNYRAKPNEKQPQGNGGSADSALVSAEAIHKVKEINWI